MKSLYVAVCTASLLLPSCGSAYDDTGTADPASWWGPWVCDDGGLAPESGCLPPLACPADGAMDGGPDGGC